MLQCQREGGKLQHSKQKLWDTPCLGACHMTNPEPMTGKENRVNWCASDNLAHQWSRIHENKATNTSPISWTRSLMYLKIIQDVCLIVHTQNHLCKTLQIICRYSAHPFRTGKGFLGYRSPSEQWLRTRLAPCFTSTLMKREFYQKF